MGVKQKNVFFTKKHMWSETGTQIIGLSIQLVFFSKSDKQWTETLGAWKN